VSAPLDTARVRTLIADDEPVARAGLRQMLSTFGWVDCVGEASNGPAVVAAIDSLEPELVFLDIQMPGFPGTEVLGRITHQPMVVFTTAYAQHAATAFELGAVDYLLKPFTIDRLQATMDRVRAALGEPAPTNALARLGEVLQKGPITRLFIRSGAAILPLPVSSVAWFEADGDYVIAQTERSRHWLHLALHRLEARLDPARFVRIHRTHVVNLDWVVAFRSHGRGGMTAEMRGGVHLAVSRARAQEVRRLGV